MVQLTLANELNIGDAKEYVIGYIGKEIDMPEEAYGLILGYAIKAWQTVPVPPSNDLTSQTLSPYDDGYIKGFVDTWSQDKLVPQTQAFGNDEFGNGYEEGSIEACTMIFQNPDFNGFTKHYVEQVDECQ